MTAKQMMLDLKNDELSVNPLFRDYELIDALDSAIEILSGEKPEGNTSKAVKTLLDVRDAISYPEDEEIQCFNEAIIALIKAA